MISEMAQPTGSMVLSFSNLQATEFWSSDEEENIEDKVTWDISDELTEDSSEDTEDEEEVEIMSKAKYTKGEALDLLNKAKR